MKQAIIPILTMTAICPAWSQQGKTICLPVHSPQRDANKEELMPLLHRAIEIMVSEEHEADRNAILELNDEEALQYVTFSPMGGGTHVSDFRLRSDMCELLQKIRKAAGLRVLPHLGAAPGLLAKVVLNSVRLQDETITLMVDKVRRDDEAFGPDLYMTEPAELKAAPTGISDKKEVMPLLNRGVEIMASKECAGDRERILGSNDERDALDYVMFFSEFSTREDVCALKENVQEIEKFNAGLGAANLLLSNVVLNSVRLQDSAIMLMVYEERRRDRSLRTVLSEAPPPQPLPD